MTRFSPLAAARCSTSSVAIIVTAIPVTRISGFPALNVSTVSAFQGTPMCPRIAAITSRAVGLFSCTPARVLHRTAPLSPAPSAALNSAAALQLAALLCLFHTNVLLSTNLRPAPAPVRSRRLRVTFSLPPHHIPDFLPALAISSPAARASASSVPFQTARSSSSPSTPLHGANVRLPSGCCRALLSRARFPFPRILVAALVFSRRLPAVPATKAPSTLEKEVVLFAWSTLLVPARSPARRVPSPLFRTCCAPVPPPARLFPRSESAPRAQVFQASSTPAAARSPPNPGSRVFPAPGSHGIRASAAPPAGSTAPCPGSSAPISSPPAHPAHPASVSPCILASSTCPEGSRRSPPRCLFFASALLSPVLSSLCSP